MSDFLLQDFAARAAERTPDAAALVMEDERLSFAEVVDLSGRLAAQMVDAGVEPGDRVGLLVPKRPLAIVAMHAVLEAGGIYVPLDAESPPARLARIVESAEPRLILSVPEAAERLDSLAVEATLPPVWSVEETIEGERVRSEMARRDWDVEATAPGIRVRPEDPAHLLFTSGSTGLPKGVVITHSMVTAFVDWAVGYFGTKAGERISGHPPLHFDLSTFDIYGTFSAGAELHLVPPSMSVDPRSLAKLIRESELTQWFSVPSVLTYMAKFEAVEQDDFPRLKRLLWCGEVLPTPVLAEWMRRLPHVTFTNLYGPTEATIASSYYTMAGVPEDESVPVPIGVACGGEELLVLDDSMAEMPVEEIGDLYIGGVGLSPGYWRDKEKTGAAFVRDPRDVSGETRIYKTGDLARLGEDGQFHFLGRADSQIKSRGYRIELGEIESALNPIEGIRECAVVGVEAAGFEGISICAAYVTDSDLEPPGLRKQLTEALPSYMLPARWLRLEALPKNQNGKIDRPQLRTQFVEAEVERRKGRQ
jgi:amino acid adenylation domain-containing protein